MSTGCTTRKHVSEAAALGFFVVYLAELGVDFVDC